MAKAGGGRGGRPGGGGIGDGTMGASNARVIGTGANRRVIRTQGQGPTIGPERIPGQGPVRRGGTGPVEQARKPVRAASARTAPATAPAATTRFGRKPVRGNG